MNLILNLGLILVFTFFFGLLLSSRRLPEITGYVLAGVILGPSALNLIDHRLLGSAESISLVALSLIAFGISRELSWTTLRQYGRQLLIITISQGLGAFLFVFLAVWLLFGQPFEASLILGSIALATAPATVFLVVKQFHAKGELTRILLASVALDDALGLIVFGLATGIALAMRTNGGFGISHVFEAAAHVVESFVLGALIGLAIIPILRYIQRYTERLIFTLGVILVVAGLSVLLSLSPIISSLSLGAVLANFLGEAKHVFAIIDSFSQPIYALFFVVGGAILDLRLLMSMGVLGVGYLLSRTIGKYMGAYLGASLAQSSSAVRKWLGLALMPQAGIAIGLAIITSHQFPQFGSIIVNIVIGSSIVYELVGPALTELALSRSGEITNP